VPELAYARSHVTHPGTGLSGKALDESGVALKEIGRSRRDLRAGLIGGPYASGLDDSQSIAMAAKQAIHRHQFHLEGHGPHARLTDHWRFPICCCWYQAGHTLQDCAG